MKFSSILKPLKPIMEQYDVATSKVATFLFGTTLGKTVIPGQTKKSIVYDEMLEKYNGFLAESNVKFPSYEISENMLPVNNKNLLQTFSIKHKGDGVTTKYIVYFPGNDEFIEGRTNTFMQMAQDLDVNVASFNYRGKGKSTGRPKCAIDIIDDAKKYIDSIINDGVNPKDIVLYGRCFGGAIASVVASKYHEENKEVFLFNDRTFKDITSLCRGLLIDNMVDSKKNPFVKGINSLFVKCTTPFVRYSLRKTNWEINAFEAYSKIPENNKTYTVIKESKHTKMMKPMFEDGLISNDASLHFALKEARKQYKMEICSSDLTQEEKNELLQELKERKFHGIENPALECYSDLRRKQKLIRVVKRIDSVLPKIAEYKMELLNAKKDEPNYENRKKEIAEELLKMSGKFLNKDVSNYKIEDIDKFIDGCLVYLSKNLYEVFQKLYPQKKITPQDIVRLRINEEGEGKIPHNKALDSIYSRVGGKTGMEFLKNFIDKMEERNSSACSIEVGNEGEIEVFLKNLLVPKKMEERKPYGFKNLPPYGIEVGKKGEIEVFLKPTISKSVGFSKGI